MIVTAEAMNQIEAASENISTSTNELEEIESRLFTLRGLARKHQVAIEELPKILNEFKQKLSNIECGDEELNNLRKKEELCKLAYIEAANELSMARKAAALKLDAAVMSELPPLKMEKARFVTIIEKNDENNWNDNGFDNIYFTVSTNPNSPQGALNKIASGGELSRFMLALKVNLAQSCRV